MTLTMMTCVHCRDVDAAADTCCMRCCNDDVDEDDDGTRDEGGEHDRKCCK